jgi:hypothetical protein
MWFTIVWCKWPTPNLVRRGIRHVITPSTIFNKKQLNKCIKGKNDKTFELMRIKKSIWLTDYSIQPRTWSDNYLISFEHWEPTGIKAGGKGVNSCSCNQYSKVKTRLGVAGNLKVDCCSFWRMSNPLAGLVPASKSKLRGRESCKRVI